MKNGLFLIIVIILLSINTYAYRSDDSNLTGRVACNNYELAFANSDGTITSVNCYDNIRDAKTKMNEMEEDNLIILGRLSGITKVVDAKYALLYLDRGDVLTYLYRDQYTSSSITYMNNYSYYGASDGALIDLNYDTFAALVKIGGAMGWIKNGQYKIIPIEWLGSSSYYIIDEWNIYHKYAKNIENSGYYQSARSLGPRSALSIPDGKYYSYDGHYLYNGLVDMLKDYKEGTHNRSVNKDEPYYSYYQFLPHRSKTNYSVDDLDSYMRNVLNLKGSIYGKFLTDNYSVMYGTSEYYMNNEKLYGANAISVFSLSRNESANGRSSIAYNKNNVFGHGAVDGAAYSSATGYLDVRMSIYSHGYGYINYGYANTSDYRYFGSHFGDKNSGMNVMYASDVYWGEKAADYYYSFDRDNGMLDYNYYQLIVSKTEDINVRSAPNTNSKIVYRIKTRGIPFIVLEEVEGTSVDGNNIWYKIQSDSNIDNNGDYISSNKDTWPEYNWNGAVYVHSAYFDKINNAKKEDGTYNKPNSLNKDMTKYNLTTFATKTTITPKVGKVLHDTPYYYTMTLLEQKGTIKEDGYVVILDEVKNGNITNYHIITDYGTNQKAWISSENIQIVEKDLVSVNISENAGYISVYNNPGNNEVLKVYNGSFLPIISTEYKDSKTYLKVCYHIDNQVHYGYIDSTIGNISYTLDHLNHAPVIAFEDKLIIIHDNFDALAGVLATDQEDGDITDKIKIVSNNVDPDKPGEYSITYSITDSYGEVITETIKVTVLPMEESDGLFMFNELKHEKDNSFTFSGFMGIKGMNNIEVNQELIFVNQQTHKEYSFELHKWDDYPYEMSSIDDKESYNYSGGWFKDTIDLSKDKLPNGDYTIYVKVINGNKEAKTLFTNIAYMDMTRRASGNGRGFLIDIDYSTINSPLLFSVRDSLISTDVPETFDPMYNFFNNISLKNNQLTIKGTSHNVKVSFGEKDQVERKLILEDKMDFKRYELDLGSISNGDYPITLAVSDNCDKTKAWYNKTVDLSNVPKGDYVLYIKNIVNGKAYYGELIDVAYTDFSKINSSKYVLSRNDDLRLRVEIKVTE